MINREQYMRQIRPFIDTEMIKVLTGIRRSGKSVMLRLIQEELKKRGVKDSQCIFFNFESFSNSQYCTAAALYNELLHRISNIKGKAYLFFDEIQEVEDWEKCINSARVDFDCDIYITGSNARLLSGELATYLAGRYVEIVVYPFSFEEFLISRGVEPEAMEVPQEFMNYLTMGGMPFLSNLSDAESGIQYLRDIYNSVVLKDIVSRNSIRDTDQLERIIRYLMANIGHTFSAASISNYFKSEKRIIAPNTILNYIKACTDAYLFEKVSREDLLGKKILAVNEKYYVTDHGIREAVYGNNTRDIDQILENIVCMEIVRRGYQVYVGKKGDGEIDFIAQKGRDRIYVQVSYLLASDETKKREFSIYNGIKDNYPKYIISMDEIDMSQNGIKHLNVRDFLLAKDWN